ncbi:hypothetical protein CAPTEDRAFT_83484, partial [Capitella teleta]
FKAAVYEHVPVLQETQYAAAFVIQANLDIFEEQVQIASTQGASIIVFPEYGLTGLGWGRDRLREIAEEIPDPRTEDSTPCDNSNITLIQRSLSCMAQHSEIYIAVNMISKEKCTITEDPDCRDDGLYLYNTNIVYNDMGKLVGRYRKWTLFYETALDQPKTVEHDYFDTSFGRIGTFICFDVIFAPPAIELVEQFDIDTALFPTAWQSLIPIFQGVGYHESWAILTGTNLLSSEIHVPIAKFAGSGINIGGSGATSYYFDDDILSPPKLLISEVPVHPPKPHAAELPTLPNVDPDYEIFETDIHGDTFRMVALEWGSHEIFVTHENTSCYLNYTYKHKDPEELLAFGVFQGLHRDAHNYYIQVCLITKCADSHNPDSCGDRVLQSNTVFESFSMRGEFSSRYVFPTVVIDGGYPTGNMSDWNFTIDPTNNRATIGFQSEDKPLLYTSLYGRMYERD